MSFAIDFNSYNDIVNVLIANLSHCGYNMHISGEYPQYVQNVDSLVKWNISGMLSEFRSRGMLNTMQDFGNAEASATASAFFLGIGAAYLSIRNSRIYTANDLWMRLTQPKGLFDIDETVCKLIGNPKGFSYNDMFAKAIMPTAGRISSSRNTAEQTFEVNKAVFYVGCIWGQKMFSSLTLRNISNTDFERILSTFSEYYSTGLIHTSESEIQMSLIFSSLDKMQEFEELLFGYDNLNIKEIHADYSDITIKDESCFALEIKYNVVSL